MLHTILYISILLIVGIYLCNLTNTIEGQDNDDNDDNDDNKDNKDTSPIPDKAVKLTDKSGLCKGKITYDENYVCGKIDNEDECNNNSGDACKWHKASDIYSYSGGLEGSVFIDWIRNLGLMDSLGQLHNNHPIPEKALTTSAIKEHIYPLSMRESQKISDVDTTKNNFLNYLHDKEGGILSSADVDSSPYIPEKLKRTVKILIDRCESGWKDNQTTKKLYEYNGNRPIMAYSLYDGLVCKNPYYKPVISPGTEPRVYIGEDGCPDKVYKSTQTANMNVSDGGDACDRYTSGCGWKRSDNIFKGFANTVRNNFIPFIDSPCSIPACRSEYPNQCGKETIKETIGDTFSWMGESFNDFVYR